MEELYHHEILGQKWGVRRYQNPDGSLTNAGRKHLQKQVEKIERADAKWARKNYDKIYKSTFKKTKAEISDYLENDLNKRIQLNLERKQLKQQYH